MDFLSLAAKVEDFGVVGNLKSHGVTVTLSGLAIVFSMLIFLVLVLTIFGAIVGSFSKKDKAVKTVTKSLPDVKPTAPVVSVAADSEEEVIAAISAAVMMLYEGSGKTPVIRSIRPAQKGVRSAWGMAGVMNNTRPF